MIVREQLEDSFCRRSRRLSEKKQGYKDRASAKKAGKAKETGGSKTNQETPDTATVEGITYPTPLAVLPPKSNSMEAAPAPYLPAPVLGGFAINFLQIEPESASAAILKKDNIDE